MRANKNFLTLEVRLKIPDSKESIRLLKPQKLKPSRKTIEVCKLWFSDQGVRCFETKFSLVCLVPPDKAKKLLKEFTEEDLLAGEPKPMAMSDLVPEAVRNLIADVSVSRKPEFF